MERYADHWAVATAMAESPARRPFGAMLPPEAFFVVSAVFHYLGPSFAVLLFASVDVLGVAWLRIVSAAVVFAAWRRPWRVLGGLDHRVRLVVLEWGVVLALMNCAFYLAIARLPLGTVAGIEFLPVIVLAAIGSRTPRNVAALIFAVAGVYMLIDVVITGEALGVVFALANAALFAAYIALGHRVAQRGAAAGIDNLGLAMLVAAVVVTPLTASKALPALADPLAVLAGIGVGVTSSVIPYVTDQLAMARVKRSTYALLASLLPATATVVGLIVLAQVPTLVEIAGVALIVLAVALHRKAEAV
jgi:inner membrane transporter RhtA